jgi:hypothetical protein
LLSEILKRREQMLALMPKKENNGRNKLFKGGKYPD